MCYTCPTLPTKSTERAKIIGLRVSAARDEAGLNNSTLALAAGLPRRTIVRIANGHNAADVSTLERIAVATRKPLSYFQIDRPRADLGLAVENLVDALMDDLRGKLLERVTDLDLVAP